PYSPAALYTPESFWYRDGAAEYLSYHPCSLPLPLPFFLDTFHPHFHLLEFQRRIPLCTCITRIALVPCFALCRRQSCPHQVHACAHACGSRENVRRLRRNRRAPHVRGRP